jgi:LmbE family N-acetylglucosaminyl deacetylase
MLNKNILAVFPHGDDEVLGMGGTLHRFSATNNITVIICRGEQDPRTAKQYHDIDKAQSVLNYKNLIKLNYTEEYLSNNKLMLFKKLEELTRHINPEILFIPFWGDIHQDHKIVYDAMIRVSRAWGFSNIKQIYCCEIISSTDQGFPQNYMNFNPNFYIKLDADNVNKKIQALECYSGEIVAPPHPRSTSGVLNKARQRGSESKMEYAEAFVCLRNFYE